MNRIRFICLALALCCLLCMGGVALAAEVDCDATYCFSSADFSKEDTFAGICITQLPDAASGTVMLGNRVIRTGDILTADQLAQMTFLPLRTEEDREAVVTYLPIYEDRVVKTATMTISIRGKEDKAPVAEDMFLETYKNRCILNLDHGWKCFPDMIAAVRRHGMEEQVLLKAPATEENLKAVEDLAPDMMFMGIIKNEDTITPLLESMKIRYVAAELIFDREDSPLISPEYIKGHHDKGRLLWCNAIVYNYQKVLSAGHTDDVAVLGDPDAGWGWIVDRGFDIIQTDWTRELKDYLDSRGAL